MNDRVLPLKGKRVFVAGHRGLVGSAVVRALKTRGIDALVCSRAELDLRDREAVMAWFERTRPEIVVLAAARVGGIVANRDAPVDFLQDNLRIQDAVMSAAHRVDVQRLLFLGSSCIYPKLATQPISEQALLTGPLEPTNSAYAVAKIAGIEACQSYRRQFGRDFLAAMPTNLYGPGDNFDLTSSHVIPALIRKFHEAQERAQERVVLWGSGSPFREFLHVQDLAAACLFLLERWLPKAEERPWINVGTGLDLRIRDLAVLVAETVGFAGRIDWDTTMPDGTPRKLLDVSRISSLGWRPEIELGAGLAATYRWYREQMASGSVD